MISATFEPNPRAVMGGNFPPPDDDDGTSPTIEEARCVAHTVSWLQDKVGNLEDLLVKRKGGRILGWRHVAANCLKDRVRQNSQAVLLQFNRKTWGENQHRCDAWCEYDDEHEDGQLSVFIERVRHAIVADYQVDEATVEGLNAKLKFYVKKDPEMRALEELRREAIAAEAEANAEVKRLEAADKHTKRVASAKAVERALKGVKGASAIVAQHLGPKLLAEKLSEASLAVVEKLVKAEAKGARRKASDLDKAGLKECIDKGLARIVQPYLAPMPEDPEISLTDLCQRVFVEAVEQKRLKVKKRK